MRLDGTVDATPDVLVARGQLHLGASIISAYTGDQGGMRDHLAEAAHLAELTGERTERLWVGFGPTNVAVHRVMGLATAGEHASAVTAAKGITFPAEWLPSRIGYHYLDLARAFRWLAKPGKALDALQVARQGRLDGTRWPATPPRRYFALPDSHRRRCSTTPGGSECLPRVMLPLGNTPAPGSGHPCAPCTSPGGRATRSRPPRE